MKTVTFMMIMALIDVGILIVVFFVVRRTTIKDKKARIKNELMDVNKYIHRQLIEHNEQSTQFLQSLNALFEKQDFDEIMLQVNGKVETINFEPRNTHVIDALEWISHSGLKSLLLHKYVLMEKEGITLDLKVDQQIRLPEWTNHGYFEIIGILIDNAIEGASKTLDKTIHIVIEQEDDLILLCFKNTYATKPDLKKLYAMNYSQKGRNRGLGLWLIKQIIKYDSKIQVNTSMDDQHFVQELRIMKGR